MGILHAVRPSWLAISVGMTALPLALPLPSPPPSTRSLPEDHSHPEGCWGTEGLGRCAACLGGTGAAAPCPASGVCRVGSVFKWWRIVKTASESIVEVRHRLNTVLKWRQKVDRSRMLKLLPGGVGETQHRHRFVPQWQHTNMARQRTFPSRSFHSQ